MVWSGLVRLCQKQEVLIMHIANISEAKAQLSALIEKAMAGEEVIIGKAGKPVARIVKYENSRQIRKPGILKGQIKIADDFDVLPKDLAKRFLMAQE
jgi:prevent-host-death family protein